MSGLDQMLTNMTVSSNGVVDSPIFSITMIIFIIIFLAGLIYAIFKMYEQKKPPVESIVLIAVLTALATVGRILLMSIPAVNLASFIIIMVGVVFGKEEGRCVNCIGFWIFHGNGILGSLPDACMGTYGSKCRLACFKI